MYFILNKFDNPFVTVTKFGLLFFLSLSRSLNWKLGHFCITFLLFTSIYFPAFTYSFYSYLFQIFNTTFLWFFSSFLTYLCISLLYFLSHISLAVSLLLLPPFTLSFSIFLSPAWSLSHLLPFPAFFPLILHYSPLSYRPTHLSHFTKQSGNCTSSFSFISTTRPPTATPPSSCLPVRHIL